MQSELEQARRDLAKMAAIENEIARLQMQIQDLREEKRLKDARIAELEKKLLDMQGGPQNITLNKTEIVQQYQEARSELVQVSKDRDQLLKEREELRNEIKKSKSPEFDQSDLIEELKRRIRELQDEVSALRKFKNVGDLTVRELELEITQLKKREVSHANELLAHEKHFNELKENFEEVEKQKEKLQAEIHKLHKQLDESYKRSPPVIQKKNITGTTTTTTIITGTATGVDTDQSIEIAKLQKQLAQVETARKVLMDKCSALEQSHEEQAKALIDAQVEAFETKETTNSLRRKLNAEIEKTKNFQAQMEQLQTRISELTAARDQLQRELNSRK
jgi:chromosome segregation ATPase